MKRLVIANRGEIAHRILKSAKARGYYVAVISTPDDCSSYICTRADEVILVSSFLNAPEIVEKCKAFGADFIHPGYGFLSENAEFAYLIENSGITFVGPTSENMRLMGSKEAAKRNAQKCGVPTLNALFSHELKNTPVEEWKEALENKGIVSPYLVKASGGGGGRGMRVVENFDDLEHVLDRASEEAKSAFHDETVFVECYLKNPRHIEIQVFGDGEGGGVFWGERECSLQRRHQKVIEEAPSSFVDKSLREKMGRASLALVQETRYRGAGTLEYLVDADKNFYFLEMNTRLQVEHPVTEMVYGLDLVDAQFELASGNWPTIFPNPKKFHMPTPKGVAIEARILAEDATQNFIPTPGKLEFYKQPQGKGIRVDSGVVQGDTVNPNFDSMIAKLIVHSKTRAFAIEKMIYALENFPILGFTTNISFLKNIVSHDDFLKGEESTGWIEQNLNNLNQPLLSQKWQDFFHSNGFREKLSKALSGNELPTVVENVFSKINLENTSGFFEIHNKKDHFECNNISFYAARISLHEMQVFYLGQSFILNCPRRVHSQINEDTFNTGEIKTPMPGKLFDILVNENETVVANQVLFVVESMKIQFEVRSPKNGVVEKIYFDKGNNLIASDVIANII